MWITKQLPKVRMTGRGRTAEISEEAHSDAPQRLIATVPLRQLSWCGRFARKTDARSEAAETRYVLATRTKEANENAVR